MNMRFAKWFLVLLHVCLLTGVAYTVSSTNNGPPPLELTCLSRGSGGPFRLESEVVQPYYEIRSPANLTQSIGSGTLINVGKELLILTAAHVVAAAYQVPQVEEYGAADGSHVLSKKANLPVALYQQSEGGEVTVLADIVWYSRGRDLALVKPRKGLVAPAATVAKWGTCLHVGEDAWYIGTPAGVHGRLEKSIIARVHFDMGGADTFLVNGCGWYGSSGGGVYVRRQGGFVLVGVLTNRGDPSPKTGCLCRPLNSIHEFLGAYLTRTESMPKVN